MIRRGWRNESVRHSLAARGIKTNYLATRRRVLLTSQLFDEAKAARAKRAGLDRGLSRENKAAELTGTKALREIQLTSAQDKAIKDQEELDKLTRKEQFVVRANELDAQIAKELNVSIQMIGGAGRGTGKDGEGASITKNLEELRSADLANINQAKVIKLIDDRINIEVFMKSPSQNKLTLLRTAKQLASMSSDARLKETIDPAQEAWMEKEKKEQAARKRRNAEQKEEREWRREQEGKQESKQKSTGPVPGEGPDSARRGKKKTVKRPDRMKKTEDLETEATGPTKKTKGKGKASKKTPRGIDSKFNKPAEPIVVEENKDSPELATLVSKFGSERMVRKKSLVKRSAKKSDKDNRNVELHVRGGIQRNAMGRPIKGGVAPPLKNNKNASNFKKSGGLSA